MSLLPDDAVMQATLACCREIYYTVEASIAIVLMSAGLDATGLSALGRVSGVECPRLTAWTG